MTSFYSEKELANIGLAVYGTNVLISRKVSFYSPKNIYIGNNVRIDDFCILSGKILIGSNIHISAYVAIYGGYGVVLEDYVGISPRTTIYSAMDDFSGDYLVGPIHDKRLTHVIGANTIVYPGCSIGEGTVVGAMSMVRKSLDAWGVYIGIPAKFLKNRNKNMQSLIYGKE